MSSKDKNNIISLISDYELERDLARNIQERSLEQKLFYINKKMSGYYYGGRISKLSGQDYWDFLRSNVSKNEKFALVSLGCGNSKVEKYALEQLKKSKYDFIYVGVDTSRHMLEMADETLKNIEIEKMFIQADMASEDFKEKIVELTKDYKKRVYTFFGGTFCNVNQTYMADVLYNLLQKGDLLWLDVVTRSSLSREDDIKLFKHYSLRLEEPEEISFFFGPLESVRIPSSSGSIGLKVSGEKSVGSLLFVFYFKMQKKTVVNFMGERIHLLPGEDIELINIRAYHPQTLVKFFKEHDFNLSRLKLKNGRGQFMFKKR